MVDEKLNPTSDDTASESAAFYQGLGVDKEVPVPTEAQPIDNFLATAEEFDQYLEEISHNRIIELVGEEGLNHDQHGYIDDTSAQRILVKLKDLPFRFFGTEPYFPKRSRGRYGPKQHINLTTEDLDKMTNNATANAALHDAVIRKIESEKRQIKKQAWWLDLDDRQDYTESPFASPMTEQLVFGHDDQSIELFNNQEELTEQETNDIAEAIRQLDIMTNGLIYRVMPHIVVHEMFEKSYFKVSKHYGEPDGLAHMQRGVTTFSRSAVKERAEDRDMDSPQARSKLMMLVYHEAGHLLDGYIKRYIKDTDRHLPASFDKFFDYKDVKRHAKQQIMPRKVMTRLDGDGNVVDVDMSELLSSEALASSQPTREYGYTNSLEDFATAFEYFMIGSDQLDPVRREAIFEILRVVAAEGNVYTEGRIDDRRHMHEEIYHPTRPLMSEPISYKMDGEVAIGVQSNQPAIQVEKRQGDQIVYPDIRDIDTSALYKQTKAYITVSLI